MTQPTSALRERLAVVFGCKSGGDENHARGTCFPCERAKKAEPLVRALIDEAVRDHSKHVQRWLIEMYQTMIDPVEEFDGNIEQLCTLLLKQAREDRQALNDAAQQRQYADHKAGRPITDAQAALAERDKRPHVCRTCGNSCRITHTNPSCLAEPTSEQDKRIREALAERDRRVREEK